jgi:hypothetical protein
MSYRGAMSPRRVVRHGLVGSATVALVLATAVAPASADSSLDVSTKTTTWDGAASMLGTAGSLWDPVRTAGLSRTTPITVAGDGLTVSNGSVTSGETFAGTRYGRGPRSFQISEKWAATGWAAEPAFTTSMARVGTVRIPLGLPGTRIRVAATVYANCFPQPADSDPQEIPAGFRCTQADVLTTGGVLTMTARPASTMAAPGSTSIVIQTRGLTYQQLLSIASSLEQVAGAPAAGAGSAQMVGMCGQMVRGRMTFDQAEAFAQSNGYIARVGSIDGAPQPVTADYRPDRFTVALVSNSVASCTYG